MPNTAHPIFRLADAGDFAAIVHCDTYAQSQEHRRSFIREAVAQRQCQVAVDDEKVVGFVISTRNFFDHDFIALVVVAPGHRRLGIGRQLLAAAERHCRTPKLFTSTNRSNTAALSLLAEAGFIRCGIIENLDAGDPELIFCKPVRQESR